MADGPSLRSHLVLACVCLAILNVFALANAARCEGGSPRRSGCRIQASRCLCGYGCPSDYQFTSEEACKKALKGNDDNMCLPNPCRNGGACSQTNMVQQPHGYRCRCEGTGYYGQRCENRCPTPGEHRTSGRAFPYECIVI